MNSQENSAVYRKGIILGLTMAEIVILIIFCLLLLLNNIVSKKDDEIRKISTIIKVQEEELRLHDKNRNIASQLNQVISTLQKNDFDDAFKELILLKETVESYKKQISSLKDSLLKLNDYQQIFETSMLSERDLKDVLNFITEFKQIIPDLVENKEGLHNFIKNRGFASFENEFKKLKDSEEKYNNIIEVLEKNKILETDLNNIVNTVVSLKRILPDNFENKMQISELPEIIARLEQDVNSKNNRLIYLQKKLEKYGNGTEKPACWADSQGRTEYIFQVVLTSSGIIVYDNKLDHRKNEQKDLPISDITFEKELDDSSYRQKTRALYEWSERNECRFFVKVFDKTLDNQKAIYKKRLRVLGEHFYPFEPTDEQPAWFSKNLIYTESSGGSQNTSTVN